MISIDRLSFHYPRSPFSLQVNSLQIERGEKVAFVGPSGSGKTTLLKLIAGIALPDSGSLRVEDSDVARLSDAQRRNFRIARIGQVFQQFELLPYLRVRENIRLPFLINQTLPWTRSKAQDLETLASRLGLSDKLQRFPSQLSQGEQQRVAIARALIHSPPLLLADEPTGNLDPTNKQNTLSLLFEQIESHGATLIVVTHDTGILDGFTRVIDFSQFQKSAGLAAPTAAGGAR